MYFTILYIKPLKNILGNYIKSTSDFLVECYFWKHSLDKWIRSNKKLHCCENCQQTTGTSYGGLHSL